MYGASSEYPINQPYDGIAIQGDLILDRWLRRALWANKKQGLGTSLFVRNTTYAETQKFGPFADYTLVRKYCYQS